MTNLMGGAPLPVTTGGSGPTEQRAAVPVYVVSGGQAPIGQRARRVVVVTSGQVEGGAAMPVYDAGSTALYSNEAALPVYVVQGSLGIDPALVYTNKVKALGAIAYFPQAEASGTVCTDESGNARHGAYKGVGEPLLGQTGVGDGRTSALYDGSNDFANIFTAGLAGAFSGVAGTIFIWAAGTASAGTAQRLISLQVDGSNLVRIRWNATNGALTYDYVAGGTAEQVVLPSGMLAGAAFASYALTWDRNAGASGEMKAYKNGAQVGGTQGTLGTWVGSLTSTLCCVGAADTSSGSPFTGRLAHTAVFNRALSAAELLSIAAP